MQSTGHKPRLAVVIPTYKRPDLLRNLLGDLLEQSVPPDEIVIVDGDPESGAVKSALAAFPFPRTLVVKYVPSNHPNAPYQRYLGIEAAGDCDFLIFNDDDIRIFQRDAFQRLLAPFGWGDRHVVGVTPHIDFPARGLVAADPNKKSTFASLRSSFRVRPGGVTPTGDRVPPIEAGNEYSTVEWLRGGMMCFRRKNLDTAFFSEDVFALSHIQCGLGADDTYLSRRVGVYGELLQANHVTAQHLDVDQSKAHPSDVQRHAYAQAYSRRFLNDHYRVSEPTIFMDRLALVGSYAWNTTRSWLRVIARFNKEHLAYALGYTLGALRGVLQAPTASNLAPLIDWRGDSNKAVSSSVAWQEGSA